MKRFGVLIVGFFLMGVIKVHAQTDTLIYAEGKIINAATRESVAASISYQSLPYGSKVGMLNGSSYRFPMYDKEKYEILIEAPGFAPSKYMLDPAEANDARTVVRDIELGLPGSASALAETAHTVGKEMRLDNLIFEVGKSKIAPESYPEIDQVVTMMNNYPKMVIQLEGHTDFRGDPKLNMKLSQERVDAVKTYIVAKGISKGKIKTKAFGGTQPISREDTEKAHAMNRRVVVRIIQN